MKYIFIFVFLISIVNAFSYGNIAVIGPTGKLGRQVVQELSNKKISTKILNRHFDYNSNKESSKLINYFNTLPNIKLIDGDVNDIDSLIQLLEGIDTCLVLHGSNRITKFNDIFNFNILDRTHPMYVNYFGIKNIIYAAEKTKTCKHIIRVTGNGENQWSIPSIIINLVGSMNKAWNYAGEYHLRISNITYTIIRPGIMDNKINGNYTLILADNGIYEQPISKISYNNIAKLCIDCITHPNVKNSTLTAMSATTSGNIEDSWSPLLSKVKSDTRKFPNNIIILLKHYVAVNIVSIILFKITLNIIKTIWNSVN